MRVETPTCHNNTSKDIGSLFMQMKRGSSEIEMSFSIEYHDFATIRLGLGGRAALDSPS